MASMPLVGTYKRYKAGTQKLVTWLCESANRCRSQSTTKKSPKKVANTAKKVTTAELVELAKVIVHSKDPVIEIGIDILDVCKDAINGRSSAAKWYQAIAKQNQTSKEAEVLAASNNSHLHFLKVLENVFETLRREHKARRRKRKKQMPKLASDTDDLTNLYQHLQLDDLESDDEGTAPPQARSTPMPTRSASEGPTYELDNEAEDKSFALYCSFKDFFDIRMYVRSVWHAYKNGDMTFTAAAKVTQAAMMLNFESARAFEDAHPDLTTFDMIINHLGCHSFLYVATWTQLKEDTEDTRSRIPSHEESSDLLCMRAWRVLNNFRQIQRYVWASDHERQSAPFFGKKPEETWPSHPLSKVLIDVAFKIRETYPWLLTESWDFDKCGRFAGLASVLDPYTRQLLVIMRFKTFDAADVASTQIYLDIFDALQGDMSSGLSLAQTAIGHAKADEQADHDRFSEEFGLDDSKLLQALDGVRRWCRAPLLSEQVQEDEIDGWILTSPLSLQKVFVPREMMAALPLLAISAIDVENYFRHIVKIGVLSSETKALSAAYLYKAGQVTGFIKEDWDDMEFFIEHQNLLGTFLRRGESNLRSVAIQYAVALGVPLAQASRATRTSLKLPTGPALSQKAIQCTPCCRYTDLRLNPRPRKGGEPDISSQTRLLYELVRSQGTTIRDAAIHEQWRQTKKLSACQLLQVALEVIIDDEPHMHFDYDHFLSGCCRLLREAELHYSRHSQFGSRRRYDLHAVKGDYSTVVHNIISEAADMELRERPLANTMLAKVCKMLENHISTCGRQCKKKALDRSSGDLRAASELELLHESTSEADTQGKSQSPPPEASATYRPLDPGDANASLYGSKTHPAIEKLHEATQKEFETWSLKQDVPESVLLEQLEGTLQKNYSRVGCTKKVVLEIQDGALVIGSREWTSEEIIALEAKVDPQELRAMQARSWNSGIRFV